MESEDREQERKISQHEEEPEEDVEGHERRYSRSDEPEEDQASEEDVEGHERRYSRSDEPEKDDEGTKDDVERRGTRGF